MDAPRLQKPPKPSLMRPLQPPEALRSPLVTAGRDMFMSGALLRQTNPELDNRNLQQGHRPLQLSHKSASLIEEAATAPQTPSRNTLSFSILSDGGLPGLPARKLSGSEQQQLKPKEQPKFLFALPQHPTIYDQPMTRSLVDTTSDRLERPHEEVPFKLLDKLFTERSLKGHCVSPKGPTSDGQPQSYNWQSARKEHAATAKGRPTKQNLLEGNWFRKVRPDQPERPNKNEVTREQLLLRTPKQKFSTREERTHLEPPKTPSLRETLVYTDFSSPVKSNDPYSLGTVLSSIKARKISCSSEIGSTELPVVSIRDFQMGPVVGHGRFGKVYRCRHSQTKTIYAIKEIPREAIRRHNLERQLTWEIKLQSFLYHPNIVKLYTHFSDGLNVYLLMEYMEGDTLFTYLKKQKNGHGLPEHEVCHRMKEICAAVLYMHDLEIAHRDIKPQNIVLSNGTAKLCDFGWATLTKQRRRTYCGTFDYSSPQMLQGKQYDEAVDLWSLGVLAFELLTNKLPFYSCSRKETIQNIINVSESTLHFPEYVSMEARSFIEGLLRKDPHQRRYADKLLQHPFLNKYPESML